MVVMNKWLMTRVNPRFIHVRRRLSILETIWCIYTQESTFLSHKNTITVSVLSVMGYDMLILSRLRYSMQFKNILMRASFLISGPQLNNAPLQSLWCHFKAFWVWSSRHAWPESFLQNLPFQGPEARQLYILKMPLSLSEMVLYICYAAYLT